MFLTKAKVATAVLLAVSLVIGAGALAAWEPPAGSQKPTAAGQKPEPAAVKEAEKPPADDKDAIAYGGRVLGPDGRPVAGARLHMTLAWGYPHEPAPSPEYATTGPDGRFRFAVPKAEFGDQSTVVAAAAASHGVGWVNVPAGGKRDDLTIQLVDDDVPVTGQVVDLEGKPVPGATLRVMQINAAPGEDLGPWLEAAAAKKGPSLQLEQQYLKRFTIAVPLRATTDAAGRFRLTGVGRNRLVRAQLDGPTIVSQHLQILTRPGRAVQATEREGRPEYGDPRQVTTYYGASFRHVAAPCKPIVGAVRDKDTKEPLAGVTIRSLALTVGPSRRASFDLVRTTTDARGRYRLTGMPKRAGNLIVAIPDRDQPYVATNKEVPDSDGLDPVTVDVELKRGVWIEGKITDKRTGKPLQGGVEYFALSGNPNLRDYPGFDGTFLIDGVGGGTKEDGSYRVVGLPGPGVVGVWYQKDPYLRASDREDEFGLKDPPPGQAALTTAPYILFFPGNYSAIARIDPPRGADSVRRDVTLDPGWTFTGTVLGPDGKPLAGARRCDLNGRRQWEHGRMTTAEFGGGFNPHHLHDILFQYPEKGLIGVARPPKEDRGSVTVRLERGAAVTGRLVDARGGPRTGVGLEVSFRQKGWNYWLDYAAGRVTTDREGRFRVEALLPGYEFRLSDERGELHLGGVTHSGQTKDLGDVRMKPAEE
jgi:protocatechuate 3,4-dioxygenase beta subunit